MITHFSTSRLLLLMIVTIAILSAAGCRPDVQDLKSKGDVDRLVRVLGYVEGDAAQEALIDIGSPAVEPLIAALERNDEKVGRRAAFALGQIGDPRAIEPLIAALDHRHRDVRRAAALALARFDDPRVVETLIQRMLRIPGDHLPYVDAFAEIGLPAVESLNYALDQDDEFSQKVAELALSWILTKHVSSVCDGEAVLAAIYEPNRPGLHTLGVEKEGNQGRRSIASFDDIFNSIPSSWKALADPRTVELAVCYRYESHTIETCRYTAQGDVLRTQQVLSVTLRAAATGEVIATTQLKGGRPPDCPMSRDEKGWRILGGTPVSAYDLVNWLRPFVEISP